MKKKIMAAALSVALVAIIAVGASLAYFTDTKKATNTFTVGNVKIDLTEPNWEDNSQIVPGAVLKKDPIVTNTGTNEAYTRLKITFTKGAQLQEALGADVALTSVLNTVDNDWTVAQEATQANGYTAILNYSMKLTSTEAVTSTAFETVNFPTTMTNAQVEALEGFVITVVAEAIQADGFTDAAAAFAALNATPAVPAV